MPSLSDLNQALLSVTDKVFHYEAFKQKPPYIIWAEDGDDINSIYADNFLYKQLTTGTIFLVTKTDRDPMFFRVQDALKQAEIPFRLNDTQFYADTKEIIHEWDFSVWLEK